MFTITRRGRYRLSRDGEFISQHDVEQNAIERAVNHAVEHGAGRYDIDPPRVEVDVPIVSISSRPVVAPPAAPGFTAPNAPTGVSAAQGTPSTSVIRVSFTPGTDTNDPAATITSNRLYGSDSSGGTFSLIDTFAADATFGDETGIAPETQRFYKVTTVNEHGLESVLSSEVNATTAAGSPAAGEPAIYALEITCPKAIGSGDTGLAAANRIYFAYTGLTYDIPLNARGGSFPYSWQVNNAPAGMTVESYTARSGQTRYKLQWVNPQASASNIEVVCTDALGNTDTETYSITVGTSGWVFLDAASGNDTTGTGAVGAPWQTLNKLKTSGGAARAYLKNGTYTTTGMTVSNAGNVNGEERVEWNSGSTPTVWIAYPGHTPLVDFEYVGSGAPYSDPSSKPRFRFISDNTWIQGIDFYRSMTMAFQLLRSNNRGAMFYDCDFDSNGPGIEGGNSAFIMWATSSGDPTNFDTVVNCSFTNLLGGSPPTGGSNCCLKLYGVNKFLVDANDITDSDTGDNEALIAIKGDRLTLGTVRGNKIGGTLDAVGIGGNMASGTGGAGGNGMSCEICYNFVTDSGDPCLTLGRGKIVDLGQVNIYRNTFVGQVTITNLVTGDGPYTFRHNVKINTDGAQTPWPYINDEAISDSSRVSIDNDLNGVAADNIVDANGALQGSYATNFGPASDNPRGWQY